MTDAEFYKLQVEGLEKRNALLKQELEEQKQLNHYTALQMETENCFRLMNENKQLKATLRGVQRHADNLQEKLDMMANKEKLLETLRKLLADEYCPECECDE